MRCVLVQLLLNVGASLFLLAYPRILNWGPDQNALVSSGRHVHRHDLLYQWRLLGIAVAEWVPERLYVYSHGQFCLRGPTPSERAEYYAQRGASKAQRMMKQYQSLNAPIAPPTNHALAIYWAPLVAALLLVNLVGGVTCFLMEKAVRRRRARRYSDRHCSRCGYDLRASIEFGRCPECGLPIPQRAC